MRWRRSLDNYGSTDIRTLIPQHLKQIIRPLYYKIKKIKEMNHEIELNPRWIAVQEKLKESKTIVDLGCGNNPVQGATVGVDLYVEPKERSLGAGPVIDMKKFTEKGITFVNKRIDDILPFKDKEFDFAYSHHTFEHLEDPAIACREMMRIAKSGAIITPSLFAELVFGRAYHRWMILERNNSIFFFRKRPFEDRPFGEHPAWDAKRKRWIAENNTNPFDILLNDGGWYRGRGWTPLSKILRKYYYSHSPVMEVIFLWNDQFEFQVFE